MSAKRFFDERLNYVPNEYGKRDPLTYCDSCGADWRARLVGRGCFFCSNSTVGRPAPRKQLTKAECDAYWERVYQETKQKVEAARKKV